MADFLPLLSIRNSSLAATSRVCLAGLARALEAARDQASYDDPGRPACDRLIAELSAELGGSAPPVDSPALRSTPVAPAGSSDLAGLRAEFLRAPEVTSELPGLNLPEGDDADLWLPLQFALIRLPANVAKTWRARILDATKRRIDRNAVVTLPGGTEDLIFPGLAGVPGLKLSPQALIDPRLGDAPPGPALVLARVVTVLLWLIDHDGTLHHGLLGLFNFGLTPLDDDHKRRYVAALLERWAAYRDAVRTGDPGKAVETWVDLDEAIHSLQHNPPAPTGSWWANLQRQARDTKLEVRDNAMAAQVPVQLREMSGRYAVERKFTGEDDQPMPGSVPVGEVVLCLRHYLEIVGCPSRGRVFFRGR